MVTGKVLKLIGYLDFLSRCLAQKPLSISAECVQDRICVRNAIQSQRGGDFGEAEYDCTDVYASPYESFPDSISDIIKNLSGDASARMTLQGVPMNGSVFWRLLIYIDNQEIIVDKKGWR